MQYLENGLAGLYRSPDDASRILLHCGLDPAGIDLSGGARLMWFRALAEAMKEQKITAILERAAQEYPAQRAALFDALPEFEKRIKQGGGPARAAKQPLLVIGCVAIVAVCFLAYLTARPTPKPVPDIAGTDRLWQSIEKLQERSFSITKEIGALENGKEELKGQLQEKSAQIASLKTVTDSLERDLAELRKRQIEGPLTPEQKVLLARAEAAIAMNAGYSKIAQGKPAEALPFFQDSSAKLKALPAATRDQESIASITHSISAVQNQLPKRDPAVPMPSTTTSKPESKVHDELFTFEPSAFPSLRIETFDLADEIGSLLLLKPGESVGSQLEPVGKATAVDPGTYNVVCNTKSEEQWRLLTDVEIRPGQRTVARPQTLMGKVRIDAVTREGFPKFKFARLIPAGEIESGTIHGHPRKTSAWGDPVLIVRGVYDVQITPETGSPFVLVKDLIVDPGGEAVVKTNDEIAAIVVRPEVAKDLEFEKILICKAGADSYIQDGTAAGEPMFVYARDDYDVILKQSRKETTLKKNLTPVRGALTFVP